MPRPTPRSVFSATCLPDLGVGAGLVILGFRACAFGQQDCRCVNAMYEGALGGKGGVTLGEVLVLTRILASEGTRRIQLSAPGCGRMTRHEVSIVSAVSAVQAHDLTAANGHFTRLLGREPSAVLLRTAGTIADALAGHGHAVVAPFEARTISGATTPAFAPPRAPEV